MTIFKLSLRLYRLLRDTAKSVEKSLTLIRQSHTEAKSSSPVPLLANVLIVRNPIYCDLAKVCIISFLHFHPKSIVKVHVDKTTFEKSKKIFKKEIRKERIILIVSDNDTSTWQELKMLVVLGMHQGNEFFMDADLRWNGVLPELKGITFFVEEFILRNKSPYAQMLNSPLLSEFGGASMKNTSFVAWGDYRIIEAEKNQVLSIEKAIIDAVEGDLVPLDDKYFVKRMSEQLAFSLFVEKIRMKCFYLKTKDVYRDGSFLESSYFGATGSQF